MSATETSGGYRIEAVRPLLDRELGNRLVAFWTMHRALDEEAARGRLAEVVCVLFDPAGEIAGVNSVYAADAPLISRRMWIYRRFLAPGLDRSLDRRMLKAARDALAAEFVGAPGEPIGLCLLVTDRTLMERYPDAVWDDVGMLYAGYTAEGAQVRVAYFEGARI